MAWDRTCGFLDMLHCLVACVLPPKTAVLKVIVKITGIRIHEVVRVGRRFLGTLSQINITHRGRERMDGWMDAKIFDSESRNRPVQVSWLTFLTCPDGDPWRP